VTNSDRVTDRHYSHTRAGECVHESTYVFEFEREKDLEPIRNTIQKL
jgi:hypothetical protein